MQYLAVKYNHRFYWFIVMYIIDKKCIPQLYEAMKDYSYNYSEWLMLYRRTEELKTKATFNT